MPELDTKVAEAPAIKATETVEKFPTSMADTSVGDTVEKAIEELEAETSEAAEETTTSTEKTDDAVKAAVEAVESQDDDESDDMGEFTKTTDDAKKDNVQKRIDQLTAQIKQLKEENTKLKPTDTVSAKPEYTDVQLKVAMKKAFDEGDSELAFEIMDYRAKKSEENIIKMYEAEKSRVVGGREAINKEWNQVVKNYSTAWETDDGKELYQGASKELNVGDGNSLLYRLAMKFYQETVDDDGRPVYQKEGGQRMAVADALAAILKKRKLAPVDQEKRKLERKLAKAKVKTSTPSGSTSDGDAPRKSQSSGSALSDYIAERRKFRNERM